MAKFIRIIRRTFYFLISVAVGLLVLILVARFWPEVWAPTVKGWIESNLGSSVSGQARISDMRVEQIWPFILRLEQISLIATEARFAVEVDSVDMGLQRQNQRFALYLSINGPLVKVLPADPAKIAQRSTLQSKSRRQPWTLILPAWLSPTVVLRVVEGAITVPGDMPVTLGDWSLEAIVPGFQLATNSLSLTSSAKLKPFGLALSFDFPVVAISSSQLKVDSATVSVMGIRFDVRGWSDFAKAKADWRVSSSDAPLEKIPLPADLPLKKWRGSLSGEIRYIQGGVDATPTVEGRLRSNELTGEMAFAEGPMALSGPVRFDINTQFNYDGSWHVDDAALTADLSQARFKYGQYVEKQSDVPASVTLNGTVSENKWVLKRLLGRLQNLRVEGEGQVEVMRKAFAFNVQIPATELKGMEAMFPPLRDQPMTGTASAQMEVSGLTSSLKTVELNVKRFELKKIQSTWRGAAIQGIKAQGPFQIDASGSALLKGNEVAKVLANWSCDLTHMSIDHSLLRKDAKTSLRGGGSFEFRPGLITFGSTVLYLPGESKTVLAGWVKDFEAPKLDLTINTSPWNLGPIHRVLKDRSEKLSGSLKSNLRFTGEWKPKLGLAGSPLFLVGKLNLEGIEYISQPTPKVTALGLAPPSAVNERFVLPDYPVIRQTKLEIQAGVTRAALGDMSVAQGRFNAVYDKGKLEGKGQVGEVFGGSLRVDEFSVLLTDSVPKVATSLVWAGLDGGRLLGWMSPRLKGFVEGTLTGRANVKAPLLRASDHLGEVQASGALKVEQGMFKTFRIDELINNKLKQLGVGSHQAVKTAPVRFRMQSDFSFREAVLGLREFDLVTKDNDQLRLDGVVDINLQANLKGTAYLASIPLRGDIKAANSDELGRLRLPLEIQGSLLDPKLNIAQSTVEKILGRAVEYQKDKALKNMKEKFGEELKKQFKDLIGR